MWYCSLFYTLAIYFYQSTLSWWVIIFFETPNMLHTDFNKLDFKILLGFNKG